MASASRSPRRRANTTPVVDGIFIAPSASAPMQRRHSVQVIAGQGIVGDRYAKAAGTYDVLLASSKTPGEREPGRSITLVSADDVEKALDAAGVQPLESIGDLRRNIVLRGISAKELLDAIGSEVTIGPEVVVFVHRHCPPCMYNEKRNCRPGMMEAVWLEAGVNCEVVRGGTLREGDQVKLKPDSFRPDKIDCGLQSSGFFTRPSKRTAQQVRDGVATNRRSLEAALLRGDVEGMRRAEASYGAVGLAFYPNAAAPKPPAAEGGERPMGVVEAFVIVLLPVAVLLSMWRPWEQQP